ncbi:unnamed protein product [Parajaminaea phylloscopi]
MPLGVEVRQDYLVTFRTLEQGKQAFGSSDRSPPPLGSRRRKWLQSTRTPQEEKEVKRSNASFEAAPPSPRRQLWPCDTITL